MRKNRAWIAMLALLALRAFPVPDDEASHLGALEAED